MNCKVKGNFRLKGIRTTNPIAVGDKVTITVNPDGNAYITAIKPRENYIIRRASNLSKESHIIAANVDRAFLVVTLSHPFVDDYGYRYAICFCRGKKAVDERSRSHGMGECDDKKCPVDIGRYYV